MMDITFELIDGLYFIIFNEKYKHFKGFNTIEELIKSRDYSHYLWKLNLSK